MIYVVVAHYDVRVAGQHYGETESINKIATTNIEDVKKIADLKHTFIDGEDDSEYTIDPILIDLELWKNGERIGVDGLRTIEQLKGAAECE